MNPNLLAFAAEFIFKHAFFFSKGHHHLRPGPEEAGQGGGSLLLTSLQRLRADGGRVSPCPAVMDAAALCGVRPGLS